MPWRNAAIATFLFCFCAALCQPMLGQTLKEDRFTYNVPKGWTVKDTGILKYRAALGPRANDFSPNIVVIEEAFAGTLQQYVTTSEQSMAQAIPGYKSLAKSAFTTSKGLRGVKLVTHQVQAGRRLSTTFYFFPSKGGRYFVVTCSCLEETGSKWAAAFDGAMKSFRVH